MKMDGLSAILLQSLEVTPDGTCARHPQKILFPTVDESEGGDECVLRECELCWKDQRERERERERHDPKSDVADEASITLTGLSDHTSTSAGGASPPPPAAV